MNRQVEFKDTSSFTLEEAVANAKRLYGEDAQVKVAPTSNNPEDYIHFGLVNLVTIDQLDLFFEYFPHGYPDKVQTLKTKTMSVVERILDNVIRENESKIRKE